MKASKTLALLTALVSAAVHSSEWYGANDGGTAANGVWSSDGKPGWNGTGVPNGQGAVAYFGSTKKNTVTQDSTTGVTIGSLILNLDPTIASGDLILNGASTAPGPVTFDQDGAGPGYAVMSNNAARLRMQIGSNAPVTLNDDLLLVNTTPDTYHRTYSIAITAKISGFGNVTIDNQLDRPDEAPILLSNSSSDFEGNVLLRRGCAKAQGSKPYGKTTNTVTLGAEGYGDATLSFEGTSMTFPNPLVVSKVTNGRMRIFGESIFSRPSKSGDYAVTLKGGVTLNGDVVFDIPSHAYNDGTIVCPFAETVDSVISGEGGVAKENNGTLVFKKANTYAGGTVLKAGTLSLANGATLGTGGVDVYDGATLELASDVTVASVRLNGKMQRKGTYAALDSSAGGAVVKVPWISGAGLLRALGGKAGMAIIIR